MEKLRIQVSDPVFQELIDKWEKFSDEQAKAEAKPVVNPEEIKKEEPAKDEMTTPFSAIPPAQGAQPKPSDLLQSALKQAKAQDRTNYTKLQTYANQAFASGVKNMSDFIAMLNK